LRSIYSFYDSENGKIERLKDHVKLALDVFDENTKLMRLGQTVQKEFSTMLRLAIIFHDFGKVIFNQNYKGEGKMSFEGHETISAWLFYKAFSNYHWRKTVALSILLHHHPMNVLERGKRLYNSQMELNSESIQLFKNECGEFIDNELNIIWPENLLVKVQKISVEVHDKYGIRSELWKDVWMNATQQDRKVFLLLSQGLIAADYYSASFIRGKSHTQFENAIYEFIRQFGRLI
jgi:CRISPR-associated endonuclease Cas3-HD